jgi:hypothetical protein
MIESFSVLTYPSFSEQNNYELNIKNSSTNNLILLFRIKRQEQKVLTFGPKKGMVLPGETRTIPISLLSRDFIRAKLLVKVVAVPRDQVNSLDFEKSWQNGVKYKGEIKKIIDIIDSEAPLDSILKSRSHESNNHDEYSDMLSEVSSFSSYPNLPHRFSPRNRSTESVVSAYELSSEFAGNLTPMIGDSPPPGKLQSITNYHHQQQHLHHHHHQQQQSHHHQGIRERLGGSFDSILRENEELEPLQEEEEQGDYRDDDRRQEIENEEEEETAEMADQTVELLKIVSKQLTLSADQFQETLSKKLPPKEINKLAQFFAGLMQENENTSNTRQQEEQEYYELPQNRNQHKKGGREERTEGLNLPPMSPNTRRNKQSFSSFNGTDETESISEIAKNNNPNASVHHLPHHRTRTTVDETESLISAEEPLSSSLAEQRAQNSNLNRSLQSIYSLPHGQEILQNRVERIVHEHHHKGDPYLSQNINRSFESGRQEEQHQGDHDRSRQSIPLKQSSSPKRPLPQQQQQSRESYNGNGESKTSHTNHESSLRNSLNQSQQQIRQSQSHSRQQSFDREQQQQQQQSFRQSVEKKPTAISGMPIIDERTLEAFSSLIGNNNNDPILASTSSSFHNPGANNFTLEVFNNHVNESLLKEIVETRIIYSIEYRHKIQSIVLQNLPILSLKSSLSAAFEEPVDEQSQLLPLTEQEKQLLILRNIYLEDFLTSLTIEFTSLLSLDDSINRFQSITSLDLSNNQLKYIDGMIVLPQLTYLNLSNNMLKSLDYLQSLTNLKTLLVKKNRIEHFSTSINVIITLSNCLINLDLSENPVCQDLRYADEIIFAFPKLKTFDSVCIERLYKSYTTNDAINKYRLQLQQNAFYGNSSSNRKKVVSTMLPQFPCVLFDDERKLLSTSLSKEANIHQVQESEVKFEFIQKLKRALGLRAFHLRRERVARVSSASPSPNQNFRSSSGRYSPAARTQRSSTSYRAGGGGDGMEASDFLRTAGSGSQSIYLDVPNGSRSRSQDVFDQRGGGQQQQQQQNSSGYYNTTEGGSGGLHPVYDYDQNTVINDQNQETEESFQRSILRQQSAAANPSYARKRENFEEVIARSGSDEGNNNNSRKNPLNAQSNDNFFMISKSASSAIGEGITPRTHLSINNRQQHSLRPSRESSVIGQQPSPEEKFSERRTLNSNSASNSPNRKLPSIEEELDPEQAKYRLEPSQQPVPILRPQVAVSPKRVSHSPAVATSRSPATTGRSSSTAAVDDRYTPNSPFNKKHAEYLDADFQNPKALPHFASHTTSSKKVGRANEPVFIPHWNKTHRSQDDSNLDYYQQQQQQQEQGIWKPNTFRGASPGYDYYTQQPVQPKRRASSLSPGRSRRGSASSIKSAGQRSGSGRYFDADDNASVTPSVFRETKSRQSRRRSFGVSDQSILGDGGGGDGNMTYHSDTEVSTRGRVVQDLSRMNFKEMQENERYSIWHPRYRVPQPIFGYSKPFCKRSTPSQK